VRGLRDLVELVAAGDYLHRAVRGARLWRIGAMRACLWPRDRDLGGRLARQVLGDHDKAFERAGGIPLRGMMLARNRKFVDSSLEESGFEPSVPGEKYERVQ
jgi:hypothetical protein